MINENDNKSTTYGSRIAANNTKQRLRRIACRTAHEWLDQSDEVFEQFHEKHRCDVFVVLYPPKNYSYDPPNYSPTSKAIIDGLTDAGIWSDDNKNVIRRTSFEHGGLSGDTKMWKVELVVKELTE
ncbi:RusA family crossover junction endodeoxyribonuclease [Lactococcus lactis]